MTVTTTYPGIYLTESTDVPVDVVPATTNLTAFIGQYSKGPLDAAVLVSNDAEFAQVFGGIRSDSLASYAVSQFFANGGIGAWIVRIAPDDALAASATLGELAVSANSPGAWANEYLLHLEIDRKGIGAHAGFYAQLTVTAPPAPGQTNGTVVEKLADLPAESYDELATSITESSLYVTAALAGSPPSGPISASPPAPFVRKMKSGSDGTFSESTFQTAVNTQLGANPNSSETPLLDRIAPRLFNLLAIPDAAVMSVDAQAAVFGSAVTFCADHQAFALIDPPPPQVADYPAGWGGTHTTVHDLGSNPNSVSFLTSGTWAEDLLTATHTAGAVYYPWVVIPDPANKQRPRAVPPSGTVAGLYAASDTAVGVWKAPAGTLSSTNGVTELADKTLNDQVQGELNVAGINCLRTLPVYGTCVWGTRTLAGADLAQSPWKYVPVRRTADFIEQSLVQSLRWALFQPNDEPLWASIAQEVASFMGGLFAQGAFGGATAAESFTVACNATTTTPADQRNGRVNVNVGFLPAYPAEFVILNVQLNAADAAN